MEDDKINIDEIKEAIINSGYLIEQRVESVIYRKGFHVETNDVYQDDETGKTREIDLAALSGRTVFGEKNHWLFPYLIIECENNKQPVVFFRSKMTISFLNHNDAKMSGIPLQIYSASDNNNPIRLNEYLGFKDYHHYCKGVFSTQYCSFQKTNKSGAKNWMALHVESQHDSFRNIIKCLKYKINVHIKGYSQPRKNEKEELNIQIYYPLLILQGEMFEAYIEKGEIKLKSQNHIQYRKQIVTNESIETFQIDVIKETYLKNYLSMIDKEIDEVIKRIKRKRKILQNSIDTIVENLIDDSDPNRYSKSMSLTSKQ